MVKLVNRAKMTTASTGTGSPITLGSPSAGFQSFADAGVSNSDTVRYTIEDGNAWEIGTGTYTASGTTLSRTVSESSNSDNALNLSGNAVVFITAAAADIGADPDLFAENYDGTSTKPSATGTNTIAIGQSAVAGNADDGIAIGRGANCGTATQNIAIGAFSDCGFNSFAMALGRLAQATGGSSLALGVDSAASHDKSVAIGKSNSNGDDSFAAQIVNNTTSYGAQGNFSIAMGKQAKATGAYSTAIGESTQAQGNNSVCLGYYSQSQGQGTMVMGYDAQSTAVHCTAIGTNTRNAIDGTFKFSGGKHSAAGDAQVGIYPVLCETTDATATTFVTYHSNTITPQTDNQIVLPNNSAYAFCGTIVARQKASEGTACAAWKIEGLIRREGSAGTTVLVNSAKTVLDNTPSWDVTLSADTTNGCLKIQGTGAASTNIRWSSTITTSELTYA